MEMEMQDETPEDVIPSVKDEELEEEEAGTRDLIDDAEEDEEALPHSEILDIFEEGLARLVQDPLLCDLPIQVRYEHDR